MTVWRDFFFLQNLVLEENVVPLHSQTGDQVAQSVEHIPFKDGVPGSSPGLVTEENKLYCNIRSAVQFFLFQGFLLFLIFRTFFCSVFLYDMFLITAPSVVVEVRYEVVLRREVLKEAFVQP